jgi:hypothetical protein
MARKRRGGDEPAVEPEDVATEYEIDGDDSFAVEDHAGEAEDRLPWLEAVEEDDPRDGPSPLKLIAAVVIGLAPRSRSSSAACSGSAIAAAPTAMARSSPRPKALIRSAPKIPAA